MAYEPTEWKSGDVVTSAKLNKLEQAVAGLNGVLIVHATTEGDVTTLDKTWQEIHDAVVYVISDEVEGLLLPTGTFSEDGNYIVGAFTYGMNPLAFRTDSADGYPEFSGDDNNPSS